MAELTSARYGKDNIRLYKVHKDPTTNIQTVVEMTVCTQLEGAIDTSYTAADNSVIVATDTQKQSVYILAKQHPIAPPELFAALVGQHFVDSYPHIHAAHVSIVQHRWSRLLVDGEPHPHSFIRDGEETREVAAVVRDGQGASELQGGGAKGITLSSAIDKLVVLKSTGSAFHGFHRDEYTRLPETWDRILSTSVRARWGWKHFGSVDAVRAEVGEFDRAWKVAREVTLSTFATDNSASVQNTMYKMCEAILGAVGGIENVSYTLPNRHYFEVDLSWHKGLKNTGGDAEVYAPQTDPNGLIDCTVSRKGLKAKAKL
ncbi:uricase [Eremomyces bilateralis CBS 781.70]|uniref:Uricase n=1 Tax=Eremomyces bilateralis CBS 781.70 TaxID=1392243 RepID=A0A6G1G4L4_9PEZI|nr:uricase [Eremomyces bilateralis CBS 781.70]KAF1812856.1 uricase [Eremomyces bilateralis CBS 781.70]